MRDDGVDEPEIEVDAGVVTDDEVGGFPVPRRVSSEDPEPSPAPSASASPLPPLEHSTGHPVRDRLLARAARAREPEQVSSTEDGPLRSFTDELDRVANRHPPPTSPVLPAARRRELPPNVIVLFGALFGLALLAALFAVLIHVDPRDGTPLVSASPIAPTPTATASVAPPVVAPLPPPVKKPERPHIQGPWRIADSTDPRSKKIEGTIGHEPFLKAIEDAGVPHQQTFRVLKVMKELRDLDHCGRTDRFVALIDRATTKVVAFEYVVSKEEIYQAREGEDGLLKATKLELAVERARVQGAIRFDRDTFSASAEAAGFEPQLASVIDEALTGHATVADFHRGDRVRVVAQEVTVLGEFERYTGVEALELAPARGDEKPLRIYYFRGPRSHGYFDGEGRAVNEGGWRRPVKGARITSRFNPHRMHPILHKPMPHQGTDMAAPMGTPVGAASAGIVHSIGNGGPGGNEVVIAHPGGIETGYAHLSRFEQGLKVGDHVSTLQIIGYVGSTGRSTGPHLHFSVKKNGVFVDSETALKFDTLRVLPADERVAFNEAKAKLDALLDAIVLPPALNEPAAPAAATPADTAGDDEGELDMALPSAAPAQAAATAAQPAAPGPASPPSPSPVPVPAAGTKPSSIYMSDQDLMKSQGATDEGEVAE